MRLQGTHEHTAPQWPHLYYIHTEHPSDPAFTTHTQSTPVTPRLQWMYGYDGVRKQYSPSPGGMGDAFVVQITGGSSSFSSLGLPSWAHSSGSPTWLLGQLYPWFWHFVLGSWEDCSEESEFLAEHPLPSWWGFLHVERTNIKRKTRSNSQRNVRILPAIILATNNFFFF